VKNLRLHEHIDITSEMEGELRNWLFNLRFGEYLSREFEYTDICHDPFCNGVLLADLYSYLDKVTMIKINRAPLTISESRKNVLKVLNMIQ
jgi:hypothetical protein